MAEGLTRGTRWVLAGVLAALVAIGAMGSAVGWWAHDVLLNTDSWVETVGEIGTTDEVEEAFARVIAREINDWISPSERLVNLLPDLLDPLGELIGARIEALVEEETSAFFAGEVYEDIWYGLNRSAHQAVTAIIRDEVANVSTAGGVVSVDLEPFVRPILDQVVVKIYEVGANLPGFVLDRLDFAQTINDMIAQYEAEGFPERLNNVVVYESDRLAAVQVTVAQFDRFVIILPIVTLVIAAVALVVAPKRFRMTLILIGAVLVAWAGAFFASNWITGTLVEGVSGGEAAVVAEAILEGVTAGLDQLLGVVVAIGTVVGIVALLLRYMWSGRNAIEG